jgi:LemA protein
MSIIIPTAIGLIIIIYIAITYNRLIQKRNMLQEAWSNVDVQLKRRHDLIPNLIEAVKGYAKHEKKIFEDITRIRSQSMSVDTVKEKSKSERSLTESLRNLFAVAEAYPDLKANQNFMDLQKKLTDIEEEIQMARRYYNGTTRDFNILVESVPSNIIARLFNFPIRDYFEIEVTGEREVPAVKL